MKNPKEDFRTLNKELAAAFYFLTWSPLPMPIPGKCSSGCSNLLSTKSIRDYLARVILNDLNRFLQEQIRTTRKTSRSNGSTLDFFKIMTETNTFHPLLNKFSGIYISNYLMVIQIHVSHYIIYSESRGPRNGRIKSKAYSLQMAPLSRSFIPRDSAGFQTPHRQVVSHLII